MVAPKKRLKATPPKRRKSEHQNIVKPLDDYLFDKAIKVFNNDEDATKEWLNNPSVAFDGETPIKRASTSEGLYEVLEFLFKSRDKYIFQKAIKVFNNDKDATNAWLNHPAVALNGDTPIERASTPDGLTDVLTLLIRIEYGVYT